MTAFADTFALIAWLNPRDHFHELVTAYLDGKAWSLTDCISFRVMADRGVAEALTADHHFEQAGFRAIFK